MEIFFGIITRQAIRRVAFRSVKELTTAIDAFIDAYNNRCQPFSWTKDADELLAKSDRQTTSATRHYRLPLESTSYAEVGVPEDSSKLARASEVNAIR